MTLLPNPLTVFGAPGSPYTRKMLAVLRFRRIPYAVHWGNHRVPRPEWPEPKVKLLPIVYFGDGEGGLEAVVDSTPIIRRLEIDHAARAAIPADPALAFLNDLIEDFADEWLTKAMFHYRWVYPADIAHAGKLLIYWSDPTLPAADVEGLAEMISQRQIGRLFVVGSNPDTGLTIEASYARTLKALDAVIQRQGFLFGARPAAADFALYGQLTQLTEVDPTPTALAAAQAPRLRAWVDRVEDLSGLEPTMGDWIAAGDARAHLAPLLDEIGRVYAPFLIANARAAMSGQGEWEAEIDGRAWRQPTFPYQAKCLRALREAFVALEPRAAKEVRQVLDGTGVDAIFG